MKTGTLPKVRDRFVWGETLVNDRPTTLGVTLRGRTGFLLFVR